MRLAYIVKAALAGRTMAVGVIGEMAGSSGGITGGSQDMRV